tara:strand:- start:935 stop:1402 length:468 start_codon:yes stop_codon:yes gene_type:complete
MDESIKSVDVLQVHADFLNDDDYSPETRLWRRVVANALEDTLIISQDRKRSIAKAKAHNWILEDSQDFQHACYWANLDPDCVRDVYLRLVRQGCVRFSHRQLKWLEYQRLWERLAMSHGLRQKRKIRAKIKDLRCLILQSSTQFDTTLFVNPIKL